MWALKPTLPLPDKRVCICRDSVVIGSLHAYRKHVRSWDQGKVVRVRKQALCSVVLSLEHEMCFLVLINKKFISQK